MTAGTVTADQIQLAVVAAGAVGSTAGTLNLNGGSLTLAAAGGGINGGTALTGSAVVNLDGTTLDMGGNSIGGTVAANSVTFNTRSGTLKNLAQINNGSSLTKTTTGTLILEGTNAYTGVTNVTAGIVRVRSNTGLGAVGAGTVVSSNASLELDNNITVGGEALIITGAGFANSGALRNLSGNNTYGGTVSVTGGGATIQSDAGVLTLDVSTGSAITGAGQNVTFAGAGDVVVADDIAITTGSVSKSGSGTVILAGTNTYTGATTVTGGNLQVTGSVASTSVSVSNTDSKLSGSGVISGGTIIGSGAFLAPGTGTDTDGSNATLTFTAASATALQVNAGGTITLGISAPTNGANPVVSYADGQYTYNGNSYSDALSLFNAEEGARSTWNNNPSSNANHDFIDLTGSGSNLVVNGSIQVIGNSLSGVDYGQVFNLIDWTQINGSNAPVQMTFNLANLELPDLSNVFLAWDTSAFTTYGIIVVVPEPSRPFLLIIGFLVLFARRRRRLL